MQIEELFPSQTIPDGVAVHSSGGTARCGDAPFTSHKNPTTEKVVRIHEERMNC